MTATAEFDWSAAFEKLHASLDQPYQPQQHIMHPRAWDGEWTRCTCGRLHRFVNDEWETLP